MIAAFRVYDDFLQDPVAVRQSALEAGFDTWLPNAGKVGSSRYEGMGFKGDHASVMRALTLACMQPVIPKSFFFRVTKPDTERAYIHSDRHDGDWTCLTYLSQHEENSGTGFYRHRATGLLEMPTFEEMEKPEFDDLKRDMVEGGEAEWELTDFVRGHFNRAIIFRAPLFHARHPLHGIGSGDDESARMIHACHFYTA